MRPSKSESPWGVRRMRRSVDVAGRPLKVGKRVWPVEDWLRMAARPLVSVELVLVRRLEKMRVLTVARLPLWRMTGLLVRSSWPGDSRVREVRVEVPAEGFNLVWPR